jgi:predicted ArsR family transcriptional regulator
MSATHPTHAVSDPVCAPGDPAGVGPATRVLRAIHGAEHALTAGEIAALLRCHHTGVRPQLALLVRLGMLEECRDAPLGRRGRPATRYRVLPAWRPDVSDDHAELVRLVVRLTGDYGFTVADAERLGESHGHTMTEPGGGEHEIRRQFTRIGFAPRTVPGRPRVLQLGRCPVYEQVRGPAGFLVCAMHRGFARGVACHAGEEGADLEIGRPAGHCHVVLRHAATRPEPAVDPARGVAR